MACVDFVSKATNYARSAIAYDTRGESSEAKRLYILAVKTFAVAIKYETNATKRETMKAKQMEYLARAEELDKQATTSTAATEAATPGATKSNSDEREIDLALSHVIVHETPNVKWDDIAGLFEAKRLLQEAIVMPQRFPDLFVGDLRPWSGILLYGPPGTGKSFLAKAVATESQGSTFFSVSAADLVSKWVGESAKLVKKLFQMAREQRPSIVFIDEIDALCQSRSSGGDRTSEASRQLLTQLLLELESVGKSMDGVTLIGATNVPWVIDAAMRRRFQKCIYIPLPESLARATLFRNRLARATHSLQSDDFTTLASLTEGFSGSDIANVVREALYVPLRMAQDATHFRPVDDKWIPCSPGDPDGVPMELKDVPRGCLILPTLTLSHLLQSIANTRPSVSSEDLNAFLEWTRLFGQDG